MTNPSVLVEVGLLEDWAHRLRNLHTLLSREISAVASSPVPIADSTLMSDLAAFAGENERLKKVIDYAITTLPHGRSRDRRGGGPIDKVLAALRRERAASSPVVEAGQHCPHGWRGEAPRDGERIKDPCPSCGEAMLFIGDGGWLTCANLSKACRNPVMTEAYAEKLSGIPSASKQGSEPVVEAGHCKCCDDTDWEGMPCPGIAIPSTHCQHKRTRRHMQPAATDDVTCEDCGGVFPRPSASKQSSDRPVSADEARLGVDPPAMTSAEADEPGKALGPETGVDGPVRLFASKQGRAPIIIGDYPLCDLSDCPGYGKRHAPIPKASKQGGVLRPTSGEPVAWRCKEHTSYVLPYKSQPNCIVCCKPMEPLYPAPPVEPVAWDCEDCIWYLSSQAAEHRGPGGPPEWHYSHGKQDWGQCEGRARPLYPAPPVDPPCDRPHKWSAADLCVLCEIDRVTAQLVRCDAEGHGVDVAGWLEERAANCELSYGGSALRKAAAAYREEFGPKGGGA
jgi:hypothetical protein